jgi:putative transposase
LPDEAETDEGEQFLGRTRCTFIIKQGEDGTPVAEICRKAGISQATYFNWKWKYADLLPTEMKRLKQLEDENARLKKIVAGLTLDREMLQDVLRRKLFSQWA